VDKPVGGLFVSKDLAGQRKFETSDVILKVRILATTAAAVVQRNILRVLLASCIIDGSNSVAYVYRLISLLRGGLTRTATFTRFATLLGHCLRYTFQHPRFVFFIVVGLSIFFITLAA